MMNNAEALLKNLSCELGLAYESQDWGIINADPKRLREFIQFYKTQYFCLSATQKFDLGELIMASANEAILEELITEETFTLFLQFIRKYRKELEYHLKYWSSLEDTEEFPIIQILAESVNKLNEVGRISKKRS